MMFLPPSIMGFAWTSLGDGLGKLGSYLERSFEIGVRQVDHHPTIIPSGTLGFKLVELVG